MEWNTYNPFSRKRAYFPASILAYKVLTTTTLILSVLISVCYATLSYDRSTVRIWDQNYMHRSTYTMSGVVGNIFWTGLFALQLGYVTFFLFHKSSDFVYYAASVASHFIMNNLFHSVFVLLYIRSLFIWSELFLVLNFVNLSALYFRHNDCPRFIHEPVVSIPLAWTFVAIYWNGALVLPHYDTTAEVVGNVFIWGILGYGLFFIAAYEDYSMSFALSVLSAAIGVGQLELDAAAYQWIVPFIIMALLFIMTLVGKVVNWMGKKLPWGKTQIADKKMMVEGSYMDP